MNIAERIKQVREVEQRMDQMDKDHEAKIKPFKDFATKARTEILQFLNETGQKSANSPFGTAYWKPRVTWQVADKDEFRRHVIGTEQWELLTWAAAGVASEEYTVKEGATPPGLKRNAVNILYVTAPVKPRKKVAGSEEVEAPANDDIEAL